MQADPQGATENVQRVRRDAHHILGGTVHGAGRQVTLHYCDAGQVDDRPRNGAPCRGLCHNM